MKADFLIPVVYNILTEYVLIPLQAMQSFSVALASGQLGPLMQQFDLGDEVTTAAAAGGRCFLSVKRKSMIVLNFRLSQMAL